MKNFADLLTADFIETNTIPSNRNYGTAIFTRGGIELIEQQPSYIQAWTGGLDGTVKEGAGSRRRVTFEIKDGELYWHCTGNPKDHQIFCKHCVALALAITSSQY